MQRRPYRGSVLPRGTPQCTDSHRRSARSTGTQPMRCGGHDARTPQQRSHSRLTRRQQKLAGGSPRRGRPLRDGQRSLSDKCDRPPRLVAAFRHGRHPGVSGWLVALSLSVRSGRSVRSTARHAAAAVRARQLGTLLGCSRRWDSQGSSAPTARAQPRSPPRRAQLLAQVKRGPEIAVEQVTVGLERERRGVVSHPPLEAQHAQSGLDQQRGARVAPRVKADA